MYYKWIVFYCEYFYGEFSPRSSVPVFIFMYYALYLLTCPFHFYHNLSLVVFTGPACIRMRDTNYIDIGYPWMSSTLLWHSCWTPVVPTRSSNTRSAMSLGSQEEGIAPDAVTFSSTPRFLETPRVIVVTWIAASMSDNDHLKGIRMFGANMLEDTCCQERFVGSHILLYIYLFL